MKFMVEVNFKYLVTVDAPSAADAARIFEGDDIEFVQSAVVFSHGAVVNGEERFVEACLQCETISLPELKRFGAEVKRIGEAHNALVRTENEAARALDEAKKNLDDIVSRKKEMVEKLDRLYEEVNGPAAFERRMKEHDKYDFIYGRII